MRWASIIVGFLYSVVCSAQVIENPVFDSTDTPSFHVDKIEITKDTTFVYCTYDAEEDSWANISPETYLEDIITGKKYTILKCEGLPFAPQRRSFVLAEKHIIKMSFPYLGTANKLNFVENPNESAFNIRGIDLQMSFTSQFTESDIYKFRKLAEECENANDCKSAIEYTFNQLEASKYIFGNNSNDCAFAMYNLSMFYFEVKEYDKVIEWGDRAINILESLSSDSLNLDVLARAYGTTSTALDLTGAHGLANQYKEKSLTIRRYVGDGMTTLNYEQYLQYLARDYYYEENYPKALLYGIEVADIYEKKFKNNAHKYGYTYIRALTNLCEFYQRMDLYEEAIKVGQDALKIIEQGICKNEYWVKYSLYNNIAYALIATGRINDGITYLENVLNASKIMQLNIDLVMGSRMLLADTYFECKNDTLRAISEYEGILNTIEDSVSIRKKKYYSSYTAVLERLYKYERGRNPNKSMQYLNNLIDVQKEWNGEESMAYANILLYYINDTWAETLISKKDVDVLMNYMQKASQIIKRHYNNAIYNMSGSLRKDYWQRYENLFTGIIPMINILDTKESNSLAYDAALFYKGMLLTSDNEFKNVILSCNDSSLINVYNDYIRNKSQIEKEYNHMPSSSVIDSLKKNIQNEEFLLSQKVTRFNQQNKGTNYSWEDVKEQLKDRDIAIEIVSYKLWWRSESDIYYDAYIIKRDFDTPLWIRLCSESELLECFKNDSIDYERLSVVIWGNEKLQKAMKGVRNIYFSTSGLLNTIGMEYLPVDDNKVICDKYNLYRLSSTRELCIPMKKQPTEIVYLYGGLDYNNMINDNEQIDINKERITRSFLERISLRGEFDRLEGSEKEMELISNELSNKSINCFVLSGKEGTEESFKKLSGSCINIIHLSTHGMYVPSERDNIIHNNNFIFILSDNKSIDYEDKVLSRSFLVMSGGNMLIHRDSIPQNCDDGILTALEISHLDFKNLDLVVLSACQTGLGDTNSEGVYGLQRAFKKAGANTILMSLDKVDDEATKILMVEFYRNLMNGKTKHQSLRDAQKYLRQVDNGKYDDPKYWASFIMLDGLN